MLNIRRIRLAIFLVFLITLFLCIALLVNKDHKFCMDVPVVDNAFLEDLTKNPQLEIPDLLLNGTKVTSGKDLTTLYISQPTNAIYHSSEMRGTLTTSDPTFSLYFLTTAALNDIESAVLNSTPLSLVIANRSSYRQVDVIITTLPVMYIQQASQTSYTDAQGRQVNTGMFSLLGKAINTTDNYRISSGTTQWHIRGATSSSAPKKPYKLSLKDAQGNNTDHNFLGLGADDDWILNPMYFDDTKVREKFAMDFWNQYIAQDDPHTRMSSGEYIELIIDNVYQGLYLLQRRIDQKYLQLDRNYDILFKGANTLAPESFEAGYEIVYSPYSQEETYQIFQDIFSSHNQSEIDISNYIETAVFLNYLSAPDNAGYKNMFYLLQRDGDHFKLCFVPWDTDMSMGIWINKNKFDYDYATTVNVHIQHILHEKVMQHYPQLDEMTASYWEQSRHRIYTESNIEQLLVQNITAVCSSGVICRDREVWKLWSRGEDTYDALLTWCAERLTVLDAQYTS